jgi:hypothetical protein
MRFRFPNAILAMPLLLLAALAASTSSAADAQRSRRGATIPASSVVPAREIAGATYVIVNRPGPGRSFGWPANGGIWCWGNEILA